MFFESDDGGFPVDEYGGCLGDLVTVLWRIEVSKSRLEVLRWHGVEKLAVDVVQLLKNPGYREQVVHPDDLESLETLMRGIRYGGGGVAVFRVPGRQEGYIWFKLSGYCDPEQPDTMWGHLLEITDVAELLQDLRPAVRTGRRGAGHGDVADLPSDGRIETLLQYVFAQQDGSRFDGIIFSDIMKRKNRVVVYGYGKPFSGMEHGRDFPYEGTIAETIQKLNLPYLVVDDTFDSIKAIDWALFVPAGVRSYFAKPFFRGKTLHSVLILCATKPKTYSESCDEEFAPLLAACERGIQHWRQAKSGKA